nr:MAG TPA: hypothetical protein [Bacteriophage sp.]
MGYLYPQRTPINIVFIILSSMPNKALFKLFISKKNI